jgi:hypothetical protein
MVEARGVEPLSCPDVTRAFDVLFALQASTVGVALVRRAACRFSCGQARLDRSPLMRGEAEKTQQTSGGSFFGVNWGFIGIYGTIETDTGADRVAVLGVGYVMTNIRSRTAGPVPFPVEGASD